MRFLGIGDYNDLGAMYHGLARRGHEVRVSVANPAYRDVYGGMLDFTHDWQAELGWLREAGEDGIALFESATQGATQDTLRRDGFQVIGGSAFGDRLEADRAFGQQVLQGFGLRLAATHGFTAYEPALDFLRRKGGRYVLKFNGADTARTRNYIGELDDASDMLALLGTYAAYPGTREQPDFVLMEFVQGVEAGVGAYFNGREFLSPACLDFEHKRFFTGELGELTGEMGTIVSYRGSDKLFAASLAKMAPLLREGGYCGYINLNMIVNEEGLWPLEFTSRFGYPGFAICEALHEEGWEHIFQRMLKQDGLQVATRAGYAAGVVLTLPPFPYSHGYAELSKGAPLSFRPGMTAADHAALYYAEVERRGEHLVTSGSTGYVGVATGTGDTVGAARDAAYALARQVVLPNLRYRTDIGERVERSDLRLLAEWGWL